MNSSQFTTELFPLAGTLVRFMSSALFAVFAFQWYARHHTRGRMLFALGWLCAVTVGLADMTILPYVFPSFGARIVPASLVIFNESVTAASFWQLLHAIPRVIIGIGFLKVVMEQLNGPHKEIET
jgi:hypothetical protein